MSNTNSNTGIPLLTAPFLHYIPTSPPSQELDFHLPSRPPLHGLTVSDWTGIKPKRATSSSNVKESTDDNWKDVYRNIKCMDQLYDASFYSWLKSEENVLVTSMYLHRIANEYPLARIINALKWLISDWRLESISTLVRHVTVDWCDEVGDLRRAHLLRHLTHSWATQYTTTLITMVLSSAPYTTTSSYQRERFLRAFTKEWDFSKLSEFFMYLQSPANIDYKVKCVMLQEAARRERETLGAKLKKKRGSDRKEDTDSFQTDGSVSSTVAPIGSTGVSVSNTDNSASSSSTCTVSASNTNVTSASCFITDTPTLSSNSALSSTITGPGSASNTTSSSSSSSAVAATTAVVVVSAAAGPNNSEISTRRHHRRTSSNDVNDIKRLRLSTPDLDHSDNQDTASVVNYTTSSGSTLNAPNGGNAGTTTRRSASPDHHSHSHSSLHHLRCVTCTPPASTSTAANGNGTTATTSSNTPLFTAGSATSHSGLTNNAPASSTTSTTNTPQVDVFSTCYPYNSNSSLQVHGIHLRRRSSSSASTDSNTNEVEDPMETDANVKKRTGSSVTIAHFTDETS